MTALAVDALAAVRAAGGDVRFVSPYRLKLIAPTVLPDDLIEQVRAAKPELLNLLQNKTDATLGARPNWGELEEERAAIIEYDGGAPRTWAEALARLDPSNPPADVPLARWQQFIDDCGRFLDLGWSNRAEALGWRPLHLFGCDRERPLARYDHMGLLWILQGRRLVALRADGATIDTLTGSLQTYRRVPIDCDRAVVAWELASSSNASQKKT
jgi:hypothetical protein